ncbi:MAG: DUF5131 family protein [Nocardioides sp.]
MSDGTGISWTDATWNVVIGCDKVSPGCDHCYAIRTAHRMQSNPNPKIAAAYEGTERAGEWTGRINLIESRLDLPLRWRRPRMIFVNAQSDLFHKRVPDDFIARVFAVMALAPQHTFQVLTKRPDRMRSLLRSSKWRPMCEDAYFAANHSAHVAGVLGRFAFESNRDKGWSNFSAPLRNVQTIVSVEDQKTASRRIPILLDTPSVCRGISAEPLLGPIDLTDLTVKPRQVADAISLCDCDFDYGECRCPPRLDWVIVGGESGPGARRMDPDWALSLARACAAADVPFFMKQTGTVLAREWGLQGKGDDPAGWPQALPQQYPCAIARGTVDMGLNASAKAHGGLR